MNFRWMTAALLALVMAGCSERDPKAQFNENIFRLSAADLQRAESMARNRHQLKLLSSAPPEDLLLYRQGQQAVAIGDRATAATVLRTLSQMGYVDAQRQLAALLSPNSTHRTVDNSSQIDEVVYWLTASANAGYAPSQQEMAFLCEYGDYDTVRDPEQALRWGVYSAEQGHPDGMSVISLIYSHGSGGYFSRIEELKWSLLALGRFDISEQPASKYQSTLAYIKRLENELTEEEITEARRRSREWQEHHADVATSINEWNEPVLYELAPSTP